jgi:3-oxoadipate enol-lactonase
MIRHCAAAATGRCPRAAGGGKRRFSAAGTPRAGARIAESVTTRAAFCGLSLGGATGQWLALNASSRLDKLVLANTAAKIGTADAWNQRIAAVKAGGVAAVADAVLARWFTPGFAQREPNVVARMKAMMVRQPAEGYAAQCAAVRDFDSCDGLGTIATPTLVIAGTHDASTTPAEGRFLAEPHARDW